MGAPKNYDDTTAEQKDANSIVNDVDSAKDTSSVGADAALGFEQEKSMSTRQAFWYYRKAVMWSVVICKSLRLHLVHR